MTKKERKILKRLGKLEKAARQARKGNGRGKKAGCRFDEKRVIDTVTRLVTERVGRVVQKEVQKLDGGRGRGSGRHDDRRDGGGRDGRRDEHRGRYEDDRRDRRDDRGRDEHRDERQDRDRGRRDGGDEKRVIDMVVGLVSQHVQQIVASELDRRLGPPRPEGAQPSDDASAESEPN